LTDNKLMIKDCLLFFVQEKKKSIANDLITYITYEI
jgi:hypothetical protein